MRRRDIMALSGGGTSRAQTRRDTHHGDEAMTDTTERTTPTTGDIVIWLDGEDIRRGEVASQKGSWSTVRDGETEVKVRTKALEIFDPEGEDDEDEKVRAMSKTLNAYKPTYKPTITHNGTKSLNNGDAIAEALTAMVPLDVVLFAEKMLGKEGELTERYAHLNPGQKRMNSGNLIRGAIRRGDLTEEEVAAALTA